ncbi:hypothetical protein SDC9_90047 [bioreactor metagenome]|uniref:Uncharacterized protein n=1 Tax=bioreactor metagenome TaxID=1076179 RepID=A0A645A0L4_9ZZZZ
MEPDVFVEFAVQPRPVPAEIVHGGDPRCGHLAAEPFRLLEKDDLRTESCRCYGGADSPGAPACDHHVAGEPSRLRGACLGQVKKHRRKEKEEKNHFSHR